MLHHSNKRTAEDFIQTHAYHHYTHITDHSLHFMEYKRENKPYLKITTYVRGFLALLTKKWEIETFKMIKIFLNLYLFLDQKNFRPPFFTLKVKLHWYALPPNPPWRIENTLEIILIFLEIPRGTPRLAPSSLGLPSLEDIKMVWIGIFQGPYFYFNLMTLRCENHTYLTKQYMH